MWLRYVPCRPPFIEFPQRFPAGVRSAFWRRGPRRAVAERFELLIGHTRPVRSDSFD